MKKKRTSKKNLIKQFQTKANNYGLVVFLFIILIITVVVYTNNKDEVAEFEPLYNEIDSNVLTEIEEETEVIAEEGIKPEANIEVQETNETNEQ